jgi:hypothetical protein
MDDSSFVRGCQSAGDLNRVVDGAARRDRTVSQLVAQGLAVEEFGDYVVNVLVQTNIVDGEDVGMIEGGDGLSFLFKAQEAISVLGERFREDLDGDVTPKASVASLVYLTHSARTEAGLQFVWAEPRSGSEGHWADIIS